jgi:hypothetical protein
VSANISLGSPPSPACQSPSQTTSSSQATAACLPPCVTDAIAKPRLSRITCLTPRRSDVRECTTAASCVMFVEISLDGHAFTLQQRPYTISPPPRVDNVSLRYSSQQSPRCHVMFKRDLLTQACLSSAPFEGGSLVSVAGKYFTDVESLTCRFGPHAVLPRDYGDGIRTDGEYLMVSHPGKHTKRDL